MKNIKSYLSKESSNILEANESKDKTFIELNVGDKIYYVMTLGEKYSKIYAGKVSWLDKLYKTSIYLDIEKSKDDDNLTLDHISVHIQNSSDKKIYSENLSWPDHGEYIVVSTDRELLAPLVDEKVDKKIISLKAELEKHSKEIEKINNEISRLIDVKTNKYTD